MSRSLEVSPSELYESSLLAWSISFIIDWSYIHVLPLINRCTKTMSTKWNRHCALCTRATKEYPRLARKLCSSKKLVWCTNHICTDCDWTSLSQNSQTAVRCLNATACGWPSVQTACSYFTWVRTTVVSINVVLQPGMGAELDFEKNATNIYYEFLEFLVFKLPSRLRLTNIVTFHT